MLQEGFAPIRAVTYKAVGMSGIQRGQTERSGTDVQTQGKSLSGVIEQGTTDKVDGHGGTVPGGTAKAWQIGDGLVLAGAIQGTEADDQVAQGRQVLRAVAGAHGAGILAEGDIAHVVDRLDAPMATASGLELCRVHLRMRAAAQDQFDLFGDPNTLKMVSGADDDGGLDGVGEAALLGRDFKGPDLASFMASMAVVYRDVRRGKKRLSARGTGGPVCQRAWVDWL
jgi:hypothetical protein